MPARDHLDDVLIYQIYPKSFRDGDGDGVGDLRGIIEGLPYIADLGVKWIWLSPIFASPMADNGYDVSDYTAINPLFGSMADFEDMVAAGKKHGIRFILDIALNHTSSAHPWFQAAVQDAHSPYRDWYHFRPAGAPANNWQSIFGGPAWSIAGDNGLQYLHLFDTSQPDLNWENPAVRAAIYQAMRFWLDKGIGGFRLDVVTVISKPPGLPDAPNPRPEALYPMLCRGPRLQEFLREMHREVFAHYDGLAIGEAPGVDPALAAKLVDPADPMLDLLYHFDLVAPARDAHGDWDRIAFKQVFSSWDSGIGSRGVNTIVLSNHDLGRVVSRFGDALGFLRESAKALQALVILSRGVPFIYQGDELGVPNTPFTRLEEIDDVWAKTTYRLKREAGASEDAAFAAAAAMTRDHARTPFAWDGSRHGGFTQAPAPWLKLHPYFASFHRAAQDNDEDSPLAFARALIALRQSDALWQRGTFTDLAPRDHDVFLFARRLDGREARVIINLRSCPAEAPEHLPIDRQDGLLLSNYRLPGSHEMLRPWEVRIWEVRIWEVRVGDPAAP